MNPHPYACSSCGAGIALADVNVATEVGPVGWTRRLACDKSARVSIKASALRKKNVPQKQIHVECQGDSLKFGAMIPEDHKTYLAEAIRRMLAES